ncbi:outer membrane porin [Escherichia coli]|nr:outer membrane porin [Escherichia coli]
MKLKIVAVVVTGLLAANVAHAAEVYNKDGNKLDLYGKVTALRYFTDDKRDDGDKTYARLGFKGETGNDSNLLIVFYVQIMPDDFVMQLHRF